MEAELTSVGPHCVMVVRARSVFRSLTGGASACTRPRCSADDLHTKLGYGRHYKRQEAEGQKERSQ